MAASKRKGLLDYIFHEAILGSDFFEKIIPYLNIKDYCRLARVSSTLDEATYNDPFYWTQVYNQNFPHSLFKKYKKLREVVRPFGFDRWYKPAEDQEEPQKEMRNGIEQFTQFLPQLEVPISSNNPGSNFGRAFRYYSSKDKVSVSIYPGDSPYIKLAKLMFPLSMLLRNESLALDILEKFKEAAQCDRDVFSRGSRSFEWDFILLVEAALDAPCFDVNGAFYDNAMDTLVRIDGDDGRYDLEKVLDRHAKKGSLMARLRVELQRRDMNSVKRKLNALCDLGFYAALAQRIDNALVGIKYYENGRVNEATLSGRDLFQAKADVDRYFKLFRENPRKFNYLREYHCAVVNMFQLNFIDYSTFNKLGAHNDTKDFRKAPDGGLIVYGGLPGLWIPRHWNDIEKIGKAKEPTKKDGAIGSGSAGSAGSRS